MANLNTLQQSVAQTPTTTTTTAPPPAVSSVGLSLALVIALILALVWAARRMRPRGGGGGEIKVRSTLFLGPRERVVLLDAAGKQVLVSVSPGQVRHLHTYEKALDTEGSAVDDKHSGSGSFQERMRLALGMDPRA